MKKGLQLASLGILAGLGLSVFFKIIEDTTDYKVYTLLLNVDYIPVFRDYTYSEPVEVLFHLIISILLVYGLYLLIQMRRVRRIIVVCVVINILLGVLLYPTTALSARTPPIRSFPAMGYWLIGHFLYGLTLGILFQFVFRKDGMSS
ncbi:hypothetical protein [Sporosarcina sp. Te-1]|uniref:hypothetical protein n=1 Tax=Sporosarcina sp. Te-1 TaxID=2818390 RepID=UPI001A9CE521|nr:hypothetical protein [Sporosarcina sp. Te-1]QTD39888.1 hypothetical protein J3U78_13730 [Sporosarcina sp. Te-1]